MQAEVEDPEEHADILDDMKDECSKFGAVLGIQMPTGNSPRSATKR